MQRLQRAGFESWFVVGCVRDALLGKKFIDYDIATRAYLKDVELLFKENFALDLIGKCFGCIRLNYNSLWLEITTLHKDTSPNGRHITTLLYR